MIKEVFERTVYEGAGSFVLAKELNERGVRTHSGAKLTALSINRMLKERQYTGYLITKDVTSPYMPELQIIDQELFDQAQEIVTQRKQRTRMAVISRGERQRSIVRWKLILCHVWPQDDIQQSGERSKA